MVDAHYHAAQQAHDLPRGSTAPHDEAEVLVALLALRSCQLTHFAALANASSTLASDELNALRDFLLTLNRWLQDGNDDELRMLLASLRIGGPAVEVDADGDLGATACIDMAMLTAAAPGGTPFRQQPAVAPPSVASMRSLSSSHPQLGGTASVDPNELANAARLMPPASQFPMSLADYASLVAHTEPAGPAASGEARSARHHDHGVVDEAHRASIDTLFAVYLAANPGARRTYAEALQRWRSWLQRGGSRSCG